MSDASLLEQNVTENEQDQESTSSVAGNGSGTTESMLPGWTAGLSKEQKEALTSGKVELPEKMTDFWDKYTQLEANAKAQVVVPSKDAPKEQWEAYRKAVGIPESPDGYTFDKPQLPEGMAYDDSLETWFRATAHELGIPAEAARKLFAGYNELSAKGFKALADAQKKSEEQRQVEQSARYLAEAKDLREGWGEQFPERLAAANAVLNDNRFVPEGARKEIFEKGLNNAGWLIRLFDLVGRATKSDSKLGITAEAGEGVQQNGIDYGESFRSRYHQ